MVDVGFGLDLSLQKLFVKNLEKKWAIWYTIGQRTEIDSW